MGTYVLGTVVKAVGTALFAAASLRRTQQYDQITEGMQDYPTLQVWPVSNTGTSWNSQTDRLTFGGPVGPDLAIQKLSVKEYLIYADLYVQQRAHIGESMSKLVATIDELENILDTQPCPPFGLDSLFSFQWRWDHATFDYGNVLYVGARFIITIRMGVEH